MRRVSSRRRGENLLYMIPETKSQDRGINSKKSKNYKESSSFHAQPEKAVLGKNAYSESASDLLNNRRTSPEISLRKNGSARKSALQSSLHAPPIMSTRSKIPTSQRRFRDRKRKIFGNPPPPKKSIDDLCPPIRCPDCDTKCSGGVSLVDLISKWDVRKYDDNHSYKGLRREVKVFVCYKAYEKRLFGLNDKSQPMALSGWAYRGCENTKKVNLQYVSLKMKKTKYFLYLKEYSDFVPSHTGHTC
ncbi:hypothetical protein NQ317_014772 [Molorchus minor]|uniref:Uncharacterized protein n=1 Tax=Molorchus minor TaxID=1323400 RepID=A0ABQ9J8Z9_9CUCU|nr:hypothetical protein NQ317_014772 [Molorchus minor]